MKIARNYTVKATILMFFTLVLYNDLFSQISFNSSVLKNGDGTNLIISNPTTLQYGPDNKLYVATQNGTIYSYTISRSGIDSYKINKAEIINLVKNIPNYDDDGKLNTTINTRQITGILVVGTAANPVLYVGSSDPRIGGGGSAADKNLDTNSGIISRLSWTGTAWDKIDLIRGLPRSEENHANNGMQLDAVNNILYVAQGGNTNAGAPSNNFAFQTEYALSSAVLSVDLKAIDAMITKTDGNGQKYKYNLPTVDDPTRQNNADGSDPGDPFGGNDGLNQAKLVSGGPVQIYSPGYRNIYDLVITKSKGREGRMYTIDNGANGGWGGYPHLEGSDGKVTNNYVAGEPGSTGPGPNDEKVNNMDHLHLVTKGFYAGHPTPIRANPAGAGLYTYSTTGVWRTSKTNTTHPLPADWPPVPLSMANPVEGDYRNPGVDDGAMYLWEKSTNGIAEYTGSNFNNAMEGNLLATSWDGNIYRIDLSEEGDRVNAVSVIASGINNPLDVIALGDDAPFPGTVWTADYSAKTITILEPIDFINCSGTYSKTLDDDKDGFSNADEVDNGTNACSPASKPNDNDGDFLSDLNDTDDDGDGILDTKDFFAIDSDNGLNTRLPINYSLLNNDPGTGFFGLGFTGLMSNGNKDYLAAFNEKLLIAGGAVGAFTVDGVTPGDAYATLNTQENAFQFGINVKTSTGPFTVDSKMLSPFFNSKAPVNHQSQGVYMGIGDQDNYLKISLASNNGAGGIEVVYESAGVVKVQLLYAADKSGALFIPDNVLAASTLNLLLSADPATGKVQPKYQVNGGIIKNLGTPVQLDGKLLLALQGDPAVAVGLIATSRGSSTPFTATWDHINVTLDPLYSSGTWNAITSTSNPEARHENAFVQVGDKFYLLGGRGIKNVNIYNTSTGTWSLGAKTPLEMHHFQAVEYHGLLYVVGAFTGGYPNETALKNIYIYNPLTNSWAVGPEIPVSRRRGSAGTVVYNDKIYLVGGITNGHTSGHVKWVDEWDPRKNTWKILPDAPRARDHFHAAVAGGKIYAIAGRLSKSAENVFGNTIAEVDVYDLQTNTWITLPASGNIPTQRAGAGVALLGNEIIVVGGESAAQTAAHNDTESLHIHNHTWRKLSPMKQGRHGTQAIVSNDGIYLAAGNSTRGGGAELNSQEAFHFFNTTPPAGTPVTAGTLQHPQLLDFGKISPNTSNTKYLNVSIKNGSQGIIITAINVVGENGYSVKSPYTLPVVIKPGEGFDVEVNFMSAGSGIKIASLEILHSGGKATVNLTADVLQNEILQLNTSSLHFLSQEANSSSPPQEISITNNSAAAVEISGVSISGANAEEFKHDFSSLVNLLPSASLKIMVSFSPLSSGSKTAALSISYSGSTVPIVVQLSGEGISSSLSTIRINAGGTAYTNSEGNVYEADKYFSGGKSFTNAKVTAIANTSDPSLYFSEHSATVNLGSFSYNIPVANGEYKVRLHFAEIYWGATGGGPGGTGKRIFSANIEGGPVELVNYDIFAEVGAMKAVVKEYQTLIQDGVLNIVFTASVDQPKISAIEILGLTLQNKAPLVVNPIPDQKATSGTLFSFAFAQNTFSDPEGDALTYSSTLSNDTPLPAWLLFNASTRTFSGTPSSTNAGTFDVRVTASDSKQAVVSDVFRITVEKPVLVNNPPVVVNPIPDQKATSGSLFSFAFAQNTFSDPDGDVLTYTSTLSNDAPLPGWLLFNASTRTFSGTPSSTNAGTFDIKVTAADSKQAGVSDVFRITVENPVLVNNPPVVLNPIPDQKVTAGSLFSFTFAQNTFSDPDGDALIFASTLANDTPLPGWLSFNAATRTFSGTPSSTNVGTFDIKVTAIDSKQAAVSDFFRITVENIITTPPVSAKRINAGGPEFTSATGIVFDEDQYFEVLTSKTSSKTNDITNTVDDKLYQFYRFGNFNYNVPMQSGTYKVVLHFTEIWWGVAGRKGAGSRIFNVKMEGITFLSNYDILVKAGSPFKTVTEEMETEVKDGMLNISFITVKDHAIVSGIEIIPVISNVNNAPVVQNPIPDQKEFQGVQYNYTLPSHAFYDPDGDALTFSATMSNNAPLPAWLNFNPTSLTFSGIPDASAVGNIDIKVSASDGKASASDVFRLSVEAPVVTNQPPVVANPIPDQEATEGTAFSFTFAPNAFADPDGNVLTYSAGLSQNAALPSWLSFSPSTRTFSGTPDASAVGNFNIVVAASDGKATVSDIFILTIKAKPLENRTPVVAIPVPDQEATEGTAFSFTFAANAFADPDGDVLTYSASLSQNVALPSWLSFNSGTRTFSGTPDASAVGNFNIVVAASDGIATVSDIFILTIKAKPLENRAPVVAIPIPDQEATVGTAFSFTFAANAFADPDGDVLTYNASLNNGQVLPGWLALISSTRTFTGTPPTGSSGIIDVKIMATDSKNAMVADDFTINIKEGITGNQVTSFTLINADTDKDIGIISNGDVINLATLPTQKLNIRANTNPALVGCVQFDLNTKINYLTENVAPYAMAGDISGDYKAWTPTVGKYILKGIPFSGSNRSGAAGHSLTITFEVVNFISNSNLMVFNENTGDDWTLYPNPVENIINLKGNEKTEIDQITITDAVGKTYLSTKPTQEAGQYMINISDLDMRKGIYFIRISYIEGFKILKMVKE